MNELLSTGPISDQEVEELNQHLKGVQVFKYQTKELPISEVAEV